MKLTDKNLKDIEVYVTNNGNVGVDTLAETIAIKYELTHEMARNVVLTYAFVGSFMQQIKRLRQ